MAWRFPGRIAQKAGGHLAVHFTVHLGQPGVAKREIPGLPSGAFASTGPRVPLGADRFSPEMQRQIIRGHVDEAHQMFGV